jgi:hypothetical protein
MIFEFLSVANIYAGIMYAFYPESQIGMMVQSSCDDIRDTGRWPL